MAQIVDPFGRSTTFSYTAWGFYVTDSAGRQSSFTIDSSGNLTSVMTPEGCTTQLVYDSQNLLTEWHNPNGDVTRYAYDCCRRLVSVLTPENELTQFQYPAASTA